MSVSHRLPPAGPLSYKLEGIFTVLPGFRIGDSVEGAFLENWPVVSVDVVSVFVFSPNAGSHAPDQMCLVGAKGKKKHTADSAGGGFRQRSRVRIRSQLEIMTTFDVCSSGVELDD